MFAPFTLDLDNMADEQWSGYFFEYNKLYWNYTGERTTVGSRERQRDDHVVQRRAESGHHGRPWRSSPKSFTG